MTQRRVTVSVPTDVAETLEEQPNASAYVVEAVRGHRAFLEFRAAQDSRGVTLTDEGMAAARARRLTVAAGWTEERYAALEGRVRRFVDGDEAARPASAA
ncbi:hypothetical protein AB0F93_03695 [Micromonospora tulbaghiae]|uniref:hypothetical protein n=1 Tax=Micromonospora tulbaghiae TaxID=479978 RepID=UPI003331B1EE